MARSRDLAWGLAGTLALLVVLVGVPVGLIIMAGWPLPTELPSSSDLSQGLSSQMSDRALFDLIAVFCWVFWAQFVWCTGVEAVGQLRSGRYAERVRFAGGAQALARQLVLAVVMLIGLLHRPSTSSISPPMVAAVAVSDVVAAPDLRVSDAAVPEPIKTCTVQARDDLWHLAQKHLGDPMRWREIYELNRGAAQPDGRTMQQPDLIRPGWVLKLPADAVVADTPSSVSNEALLSEVPARVDAPTTTMVPSSAPSTTSTSVSPSTTAEQQGPAYSADGGHAELPAGVLEMGAGAAGVLFVLDQLRRVQQRRRRCGQRVPAPSATTAPIETALRIAASDSPARRLDVACRALAYRLAASGEQIPALQAVRVGEDGIEFLFEAGVVATAGDVFDVSGDGRAWLFRNDVEEVRVSDAVATMPALLPTLATVGAVDGASVLVDFESALVTAVQGAPSDVRAFLEGLVMEMASGEWSDYLEVMAVGGDEGLARFEMVTCVPSVEDVLQRLPGMPRSVSAELDRLSHPTTKVARLAADADGWEPGVLVCFDEVAPDVLRRLVDEVGGRSERGLVIIVPSVVEDAGRVIELSDGAVTITPPAIELARTGLSAADLEPMHELFEQTSAPAVEIEPPAVVDVRKPAPVPVIDDVVAGVRVNVLGPVEILGGEQPIGRPKSEELVVYLAMHPKGVQDGRLHTALWPDKRVSAGSFHTTVSRARSRLGADGDGVPFVLPVEGGMYRLGPSVMTDAARFEELVVAASASEANEVELLEAALRMVRGVPFAEVKRGYEWAFTDGIVGHLESTIADAACRLAELSLEGDDLDRVHWAARQGLLASPCWEPLYRVRMRAYDQAGNLGGVKSVMDELMTQFEDLEGYDSLHSETVALYEQLASQRRISTS